MMGISFGKSLQFQTVLCKTYSVGSGSRIKNSLNVASLTAMNFNRGKSTDQSQASQNTVNVSQTHLSKKLQENVSYVCTTIEDFITRDKKFDAVVMSEVIEHVDNPEQFIGCAVEVLKPGGSFFLTTINRTTESYLGAIIGWEYIFRILPIGTHTWSKFLTPEEVDWFLKSFGLRTISNQGMRFNPINNSWKLSNRCGMNYGIHAVKD